MGLLDALFPSSDGGGLLDFLKNNASASIANNPGAMVSDMAQYGAPPMPLPYQPGQVQGAPIAAPQGPIGAPGQPAAPAQASPLALAPQGAQPAPQPGLPQPQDASPLSGVQNFFNRTADALGSISRGGSMLGAVRGQFDDPRSQAAAQSNMTARALIAKGVDPQVAIAAVQPGNTAMLGELIKQIGSQGRYTQETDKDGNVWNVDKQTGQKTVALQAKSDKYIPATTTNPDGTKTTTLFNTDTKEFVKPPGSDQPASGKFSVPDELTGPDRMKALQAADPMYARKIQAIVNGDLPLPTGVAALKPDAKRIIEDALAVDGATSASDFQTRAATRKDYASGIASRVTKSINTTIGHFATLDNAVDKLGNYSLFPKIANTVHDIYGSNLDPNYQKAKANFETNKEAAVKELDFALSGGHSSVSGSAELRDKFNRADSPEALHAAITEAMSLLQKRLESHTKAFTEGTKSQRDPQDFIYPENRAVFNKLLGQEGGNGAPAGSAPSGIPSGWSVQVH
jgi:hypothetical protein